ncbi:MAG: amidohydrolase family protein [Gemmatimonadaceae bacterium]|nr:amidohydrolase family protein [Gemmatimonadaceae bacterium]
MMTLPRHAFSSLCLGACVASAAYAQTVAISNASVVDVESGRVTPARTLVIEGNRIRLIGAAGRVTIPDGATRVDGTGRYVIPGLWDMHVHATGFLIDRLFLPTLVANGVTGVRDMFGRLAWYDSARAAAGRGSLVMPRLVGSGHILDGAPAIWPGSIGARTADEAGRAVDSLAAAGAAFIKVYSRLTPEEFRAIATEARAKHLEFAGHVPSLVAVDEAVQLGMRSIEHLQMFTTACSSQEESLRRAVAEAVASPRGWDSAAVIQRGQLSVQVETFDRARCRALAQHVARSDTWMVPTIVVLRSTSYLDDSTLRSDPRLRFIPRFFSAGWDPRTDFRFRAVTPEGWAMRKRVYDRQLEIVRLLHDAGAKFLAGTDLSNPYIYPGLSLHDELAHFVANGFTPLEALQSATRNPARFLHATDSLGAVKQGYVADLVVLDANPLVDIRNVARVHAVVLNGRLIDAAQRESLLRAAEALAAPPARSR